MNKTLLIICEILIVIWLSVMIYFVVTEQWLEIIKNILILFFSFICGVLYSLVEIRKENK